MVLMRNYELRGEWPCGSSASPSRRWRGTSFPKTRTALCLRARIKGSEGVGVWKCEKHGTAHYSGLQTCGSV